LVHTGTGGAGRPDPPSNHQQNWPSCETYGIDSGSDADEEAAATCAQVDLMYMHFEEFALFIAHKIFRPNRGKED
jgi:hypothetical protein